MSTQRPTTVAARAAKAPATVPTEFKPRFWSDADQRQVGIKEIKRRCELLRQDVGADSYQKDLLCQRATFIAVQLETMEADALEGKPYSQGVYTQMSNALLGLLRTLGLDRPMPKASELEEYLQGDDEADA